jgi:hypothetical protein
MGLLVPLEQRVNLVTRDPLGLLVYLEREVFQDLLETREEEEILVYLVWKDLLVRWVREDLKVLLDHLGLRVKLEVLEILVKLDLLERWEQLV